MFSKRRQRPTSTASRRYRESTHLIPTPGIESPRTPTFTTWELTGWFVLPHNAFMIILGVGIEVALAISRRKNGFIVPQHNALSFAPVSFLTSFFPTLLIIPLSLVWQITCRTMRWYQPWVALADGSKRVEESLLLNYHFGNIFLSLFRSLKRRDWLINISIITALVTAIWQPLAGALLTVTAATTESPTTLQGATTLGLIPDVSSLNAFLAAAGFTEASFFQNLPPPPFVRIQDRTGWATAQFTLPDNPGVNASVYANITGIGTDAGCSAPAKVTLDTSDSTNYALTATGADGCTAIAHFDPSDASQQYGTAAPDPASCGLPASTPQQFGPVMFWFFANSTSTSTSPQGRAVICRPSTQLSDVGAYVDLNNGTLVDVVVFDVTPNPGDLSAQTPFNGSVYNAVLFGDIPGNDKFIAARATAIGSQIPGAILRLASQNASLLQSYFDPSDNTGFLNLTQMVYTEHLAVSAKSVYFVPAAESDSTVAAKKWSQDERLFVDPLAAHSLATVLILVGLIGATLFLVHRYQRRNLHLVVHPGTIAGVIALTSHSGFGELLYPYDDADAMRRKLGHLRFSLDRRTGAVIADEYGYLGEHDSDSAGESDMEKDKERTLEGGEGSGSVEKLDMNGRDVEKEAESEGLMARERSTQRNSFPVDIPYEHEPFVPPRTPPGKF